MNGELKVARIKAENAGALGLLGAVVAPEALAHAAGGKLAETRKNVVERRNLSQTVSTLGKYCRVDGFDPTRSFQHVANIDNEVWQVILGMFAKHDFETGEFEDDGLLYRFDPDTGNIRLNKPFFYALIEFLEASGYPCDMRGKIKL